MRRVQLAVLCSAISTTLWAGKEFTSQQGETVANGELIVKLKPGIASTVIQNYLPGSQVVSIGRLNFHLVKAPGIAAAVASRLANDASVDFVEPNHIRHTTLAAPGDPYYSQQWSLQTLQAVQAWTAWPNFYRTAATTGQRVTVAVLDTGADCTHPDFKNSGGTSTDSASGGQLRWSGSQAPIATTIAGASCAWQDDYGHGTHVAGTIVAATNNSVGVAGIAYQVQVMNFKVLDNTGSGDDLTIANAIMAATDAGAQIVSLSLGGTGYSQSLQTAINYAWQHNTLVVAAAGNSSSSGLFFPADANYAIAVSATDSSNSLASFSNFGPYIGIAAPGVNIVSTLPTYSNPIGLTNYGSLSGTSMATPHVSAVAGLVAMTTPNVTAASIAQRIQQTAASTNAGGGWSQTFGYGIVNAYNAVAGVIRAASYGNVRGQVTDGSGVPIASAVVTIGGQSFVTDSSGLYTFGNFSAGNYPVTVSASGYAAQNLTVTVTPGATSTLAVMMGVSYGRFTGSVTDQGLGIPGTIVQAIASGAILGTAVADANGTYTLWVPGGTYSVRASGIGRTTATVPSATVNGNGITTVNLTIPSLGAISGFVTNNGAAVSNAQIAITGTTALNSASDATGHYSTLGLPAGAYTVACTVSGLGTITANVTVSADTATTQNCAFTTTPSAPPAPPTTNTATFVKTDTTTKGSWKGVYGSDGRNVIDDSASYPSYVTVTPSNNQNYIWTGSTSDVRALQTSASRIAATWYNSAPFTIDLNFTDGGTHQFALYSVDWDTANTRSQRIDVMDGSTVLDSRTISSFNGGIYAVWKLSGHVTLRITNTSAVNAVVSGLFFDSATATAPPSSPPPSTSNTAAFVRTDAATKGTWKGVYGSDGRNVIDDSVAYPNYVTVTPGNTLNYVWASTTSDVRGLQTASSRIAATWYNSAPFTIDLNFTDGAAHQFALYSVDWDSANTRAQRIDVMDGSTVLDTRTISSFNGGIYAVWKLSGHVTLRITSTGAANGVVSGLFFDPVTAAPPSSGSNSATFVKADTATQGSWKGKYGTTGYNVIDDTTAYANFVSVVPANQLNHIWSSSTTDVRALQSGSSSNRIAATWYNSSPFTIDVNFTDGVTHQFALYSVDWDSANSRSLKVEVMDGGTVLDTRTMTSFSNGQYLVWKLTGHVTLRITSMGGANAVVSGLFFDPAQ